MVNHHQTIRQILGHANFDNTYKLQTLKDNVSLLTPSVLDQINQVVIKAGHQQFKKNEVIKGRCDSFVVETDVHYPTDTNLLYDAIRIILMCITKLCKRFELTSWNDSFEQIQEIKNSLHRLQKLKHSTSKDEEEKQKKVIIDAHRSYLNLVKTKLEQVFATLKKLLEQNQTFEIETELSKIQHFIKHAERQIDQIDRRVIKGVFVQALFI